MSADPVAFGSPREPEPVIKELQPISVGGELVPIRVAAVRYPDGVWRGRLIFGYDDLGSAPATAEILYGGSERELLQSVLDLRDHHLKDLYRAVTE